MIELSPTEEQGTFVRRSYILLSLLALLSLTTVQARSLFGQVSSLNRFEDVPLEDVLTNELAGPANASNTINSILRQADQIEELRTEDTPTLSSDDQAGNRNGNSVGNVSDPFEFEERATDPLDVQTTISQAPLSTTTVHATIVQPPSTFDVSQPLDVEVESGSTSLIGHDLLDGNTYGGEVMPGVAHGDVIHDFAGHHPTDLTSGYDGMVDAYVQQLLSNGCATPGTLPGLASVATDPTLQLCAPGAGATASGWYAQGQVLFLQPFGDQRVVTSVDDLTGRTVLATDQLFNDFEIGFDGRVGFRTGYSALEIGWWSLFATSDNATAVSPPGNLFSVINFIELDINFNGAQLHQIESELEVHTFELSKRHLLSNWNTGRLRFASMWGLRFTRISDQLRYTADLNNTTLGDPAGEVSYDIEVDNRLFGPQVGGSILWQMTPKLSAFMEAKTGVYFNYIDQDQFAGSNAAPATIVAGPDTGSQFVVDQDDQQAALMTEIQFNLEYAVVDRVKLVFGYRVFAASGVAQSRSQIPWRFGDLDASVIDASDALLLHGLQFGFDANF